MNPAPPRSDDLIIVRETAISSTDTRDQYRQKIARITLDSMVQFVGLLDAAGTVLEINQVALDGVGIKLSDVEGKPFWTTFWWQVSEDINATLRDAIRRASQGEFVRWDAEIYGRAGGKETIIIDASLMPVKDARGNIVFIAAEGRDITEKKAYEREIARQREELAKLDELKTQFFANVSHEFRTPLTLLMGPLESVLAHSEKLLDTDREHLELAHRSSLRLLKLVNTLLDFSRIEAGRVQGSFEPTDLAALTAELASGFRSAIEAGGMKLVVDCPALPEMVYVDREMWEKIVLNLLSNAFKFTFEGEIAVCVRQVGPAAELTVRDTGTGIPSDEIPQLFERFHRVKGAKGRSYEGSGIGLALVKELVTIHGGTLTIQSEIGRGSRFAVTFPLGKDHLPPAHIGKKHSSSPTNVRADAYLHEALRWLPNRPVSADGGEIFTMPTNPEPILQDVSDRKKPYRILLADDNADMREYVHRLLNEQYEVTAVADGEAAIESARSQRPDLILTDIMMPRLDGLELLRAVRADSRLRSVPLILLSARAGEEARVQGLDVGADDYLVKPFSPKELLARVRSRLAMATLRRQADQASVLLGSIVESSDDAIVSKTLEGIITSWNPGAERIFGYTAQEAVGQPISLIIPVDRLAEERTILERLRRGERIDHFDTVRLRKDGTKLDISLTISPVKDSDGNVIGVSKIARDVTDRKRVEKALRESEERLRTLADALDTQVQFRTQELQRRNSEILTQSELLRDLSGRLMTTQDEERRRIARELHDSAGQSIAALSMDLSRLENDAERNPARLTIGIKDAQDRLRQLSQEIRTTSYLLHPPMLDEIGLSSALEWYVEGLAERSGLEIKLSIAGNLQRLAPELELAIFRLVQECLTNIHRHSGSKTAEIQVARDPDKIYVGVQDHGKGMSQELISGAVRKGVGVGVTGMRERVRQLHGELIIESDPTGTRITATFPHKQQATSA